jgi:glycosyltransferase involved in cell wall biosynthesis
MGASGSSGYEILNLVDSSPASLAKKGNISHLENLYNPGNPGNFFSKVHIVSYQEEDLKVTIENPSIVVHFIRLPFKRIKYVRAILNFLHEILALRGIIKENDIALIRSRGIHLSALKATILGELTRVPIVVSLGGDHRKEQIMNRRYHVLNSRFLSFKVEEYALKKADMIFCINNFVKKYVVNLGADESKLKYVPVRIDMDSFRQYVDLKRIRMENGLKDEPIVLFCGRFERDKQVDVLFESIPLILQKRPETKFIFIGDGSLREGLTHYANEKGFIGSTIFKGFLPQTEVAAYMKASDIIWIPLSGFVIYEAAACGKPIVAFDADWHSEFIENGRTGLLVRNRDYIGMADAVVKLLEDKDLSESLGKKAGMKFRREFPQDRLMSEEISIYREFLEKRLGAQ